MREWIIYKFVIKYVHIIYYGQIIISKLSLTSKLMRIGSKIHMGAMREVNLQLLFFLLNIHGYFFIVLFLSQDYFSNILFSLYIYIWYFFIPVFVDNTQMSRIIRECWSDYDITS